MYEYTRDRGSNDPLFYFTTIFNYIFEVRLTKYPADLQAFENIFSVSVDCLNEDFPKKDIGVGKTVYQILFNFLNENKSFLLMYVCDIEDKKAVLRQRKFSCWHSSYSDGTFELSKFEIDIVQSELKYYSAIIFSPSIYSSDLINNTFNSEMAYINGCK